MFNKTNVFSCFYFKFMKVTLDQVLREGRLDEGAHSKLDERVGGRGVSLCTSAVR